jgi:hypothetical protein
MKDEHCLHYGGWGFKEDFIEKSLKFGKIT